MCVNVNFIKVVKRGGGAAGSNVNKLRHLIVKVVKILVNNWKGHNCNIKAYTYNVIYTINYIIKIGVTIYKGLWSYLD